MPLLLGGSPGVRTHKKLSLTQSVLMQRLALTQLKGTAMSARKVKNPWSILVMCLVMMLPVAVFTASTSSALDGCGFGYYAEDEDEYGDVTCGKSYWEVEDTNDGFDRIVLAYIAVDNSAISNNGYDFDLMVRCTSKKLEIFASSTYELFYENAYTSGGTVQVKFDSGKVVNYKFTRSTDREAIFLNNPKTFSTALSKAKSKVSLKFTSSRGSIVLQFPVADFAQSKKTFTSAGCKF
jgi:hypothetical protein